MKDLNLIRKVAWTFTKKTGMDYDELFGEASLAYSEAIHTYDPTRGAKFITHAYTCMRNHLINFCKKETARRNRYICFDYQTNGACPKEEKTFAEILNHVYGGIFTSQYPTGEVSFYDIISEWPEDARKVATMVLDNVEQLTLENAHFRRAYQSTPHKTRKRIKKKLVQKGWTGERAEQAMKQVKQQLQTV